MYLLEAKPFLGGGLEARRPFLVTQPALSRLQSIKLIVVLDNGDETPSNPGLSL